MNKAEAMRAFLDELTERVKLAGELRAAKRELRATWKAMSPSCPKVKRAKELNR